MSDAAPAVPAEVEELIADAVVNAHLATSVDDRPHVAPVWFDYRDGVVSVLTGGKKLANLRENPRVALSIERADGADAAWTVTLLGTARVVEDAERKRAAVDRVLGKYGASDYDSTGALVEIDVGSAAVRRYD